MKIIFYLISGIFLCGLISCHKEARPTVIQGVVTNVVTGEPIPHADIFYSIIINDPPPGTAWKELCVYTDDNGFYSITVPPGYGWAIIQIRHDNNYLPKILPSIDKPIIPGEVNTLDIEMIPIDGFIRIVANNSVPGNDSLYIKFFSPKTDAEFQLFGGGVAHTYPIKLSMNETYEEVIAVPGEDLIKIYWDNFNFFIFESANKDSIYIPRNDTLTYTIDF